MTSDIYFSWTGELDKWNKIERKKGKTGGKCEKKNIITWTTDLGGASSDYVAAKCNHFLCLVSARVTRPQSGHCCMSKKSCPLLYN